MRFSVDEQKCSGHGQCYVFAPNVFSSDLEGFNSARGNSGEVPEGLEEEARRGAISCPECAITIIES